MATYQISGKDYGVGTVEIRNNGAGRYAVVFSSDKSKLYKALSTSTGSHLYIYQSGDPDKMALEQQLQPSWSYEHKPDGSLVYVNQTGQNIQQVLTPIK